MNLKNALITASTVAWLALSPAVSQAKEKINEDIYQLVWNMLIPTNNDIIKKYKTYWCKEYKWTKIYLSNKKDVIPTWFYFDLDNQKKQEVLDAPDCKKWINI